ncbi:MAG: LemA family protein [Bacteroidetes bacterium]|nr:LemA family protein [Bacteroidota bacterium]
MESLKKFLPWIIIGILVIWVISAQRSLVSIDESVNEKWGQVETQYQRRLDLLNNLVAVVKNYKAYEGDIIVKVTEARASVGSFKLTPEVLKDPEAMKRFEQSQNMLVGAMKSILSVQENYPNLKADEQFLKLQDEVTGTENRVNIARQNYNISVKELNATVRRFPMNLLSGLFGVKEREYFKASEGAQNAPDLDAKFKD